VGSLYPVQKFESLLCNDYGMLRFWVQLFESGFVNDYNELWIWVQKFVLLTEFGVPNIVLLKII